MAPSRISSVGMWGRKSFPTKKHMNTALRSGVSALMLQIKSALMMVCRQIAYPVSHN